MGTDRKPLAGKVAVVTGAGKNIGRAIALALAADGAAVIVNGRKDRAAVENVVGEIKSAGGKAIPHIADVSDGVAVSAMIAAAVSAFGGIDIAVSNAGLRRQTPFLKMDFAEWREILSVALDGAFHLAKAVVPSMIARGGGAIVGLSGISHHVGMAERVHVNASKAGLEGFVRGLAVELAPHNIRVNAVAPGAIETVRGASAGVLPERLARDPSPLGRRGTPEEIAALVRLLVGPDGAYITGQTIHVNGGRFLAK
ncbi:MAG TPA: SDR family oxidoreductase [Candidatus Cybelea sp.]|nr:SDR family oxidoreductase [Candidatus Cybelea sp.]